MRVVKEQQIINEMFPPESEDFRKNRRLMNFILNRFFFHTTNLLLTGRVLSCIKKFSFSLQSIEYGQVPKARRKMFRYSTKVFPLAFIPVVANKRFIKEFGYNYRPNKFILDKIYNHIETDAVYSLINKK